jgi:hypothetical protein
MGFAIALGLQAIWILTAELTRPEMRYFPVDAAEAKVAAAHNPSAAAVAWLGWPRGDLWTDYAVTANATALGDRESGVTRNASDLDNHAEAIAETAAKLAPSDARVWLLLANRARAASNADGALAQLKMSYYTSPYNDDLFPLRIQIAAQLPSISEEELGSFVEYELGVVIRNKPGLKGFIAPAYRKASPAGRRFFEIVLAKLDPKYLAELRTAKP